MKVFWAWQSDLPGRISRFVIRDALDDAITELKEAPDVDEPPEEARRVDLHLDHDTKDVTGMPSVADTILAKIRAATVFVGDVTPVGAGPDIQTPEGAKPGRPLMNPNVAIELGYALHRLTDTNAIAVLNLAYGGPECLPFDIKHKRWPVTYRLVDGATKQEILAQRKILKDQFVTALKGFLKTPAMTAPVFEPYEPLYIKEPDKFFFGEGQCLGHSRQMQADMFMPFRDVLYLRVMPTEPLPRLLSERTLLNNVGIFGTFGQTRSGAMVMSNELGVATFEPAGNTDRLDAILQYFPTGEVWGVNADIMRQGEQGQHRWYLAESCERAFAETLFHIIEFMTKVSNVKFPIRVIAGTTGLKDRTLTISGHPVGAHGRFWTNEVRHEATLPDSSLKSQDAFLIKLFEKIFDQTGSARPQGLFGFPPHRP